MIKFYDDIKKSGEPNPKFIDNLRGMLDKEEPETVRFIARTWENQKNAVTYEDLRKAIVSGELDEEILLEWNNEYSVFVYEKLYPKWVIAMKAAAKEIEEKRSKFIFDIKFDGTKSWLKEHSAKLIADLSASQRTAINAIIQRASVFEGSADALAMAIRPTIGLYKGQVTANLNYYESVKTNLLKTNPHMREKTAEKRALKSAAKYAEKQHRYRAMNIARTELASGYGAGRYYGIKQAQKEGLLGKMIKRASSAGDDRVCAICKGLDRMEIEMDEYFIGNSLFNPFHPGCRCIVQYTEVEPPIFN